ncbi:hypothetical protein HJC10_31285 [Corallococcus exiguus]|uniref:hypothetical protein n=1 Tax=Corallococcus TaxID=83461 RepID=UPI000EF017B8|nr:MULTISPECIES: hypothetical protein [Corallococcus]NNB90102.1 hypothetical protein [Corallococcus exiguus]NNB97959.1 hypothetical protein [Corallococcus exiguus]NNC07320.1 hypothetical protein [Corallococcus exiguus]NPC50562.1 hypothetical protein [Corallococcus exiguus]RKH84798.1 hypothetical protein D7X99_08055 [Corallococcus sp. AB032C]
MAPSPFQAEFRVLIGPDWVPLPFLEGLEAEAVDMYLRRPSVTCCSFQGGFFIDVGGHPFSDDGSVDEFWMTWSWFFALKALLDGAAETGANPWEESHMRLWRQGDVLSMEDRSASEKPLSPRVEVAFLPFAQSLARQGLAFLAWAERVLAALDAREPPVPDSVKAEFRQSLTLPRDVLEDVASKVGVTATGR